MENNPYFLHSVVLAPDTIVGYHGCRRLVAKRLLDGEPFRLSKNDYDWLGSGAYFWEYAPFRAWEWASRRFGAESAVLQAKINLGDCLNLLDAEHFAGLQDAYDYLLNVLGGDENLPANLRGRNRLDRLVIETVCESYASTGRYFDTVRGCFPEGTPLYAQSKLLSHTHVQIAVRNPSCISELNLVDFTY